MIRVFYALAALAWIVLLFPYPATVFVAACCSCASYPLYERLYRRWPGLPAVIAYACALVVAMIVPVSILIVLVLPQARAGYNMLRVLRAAHFQLPSTWLGHLDKLSETFSFIPGIEQWLHDLGSNIEAFLGDLVRVMVSGGFGVLGGTMTVVWTIFLFITFSVLGVVYGAWFRKVSQVFTRVPEDIMSRFITAIRAALHGVVMGVLLVALAQGILCGIGFYFAGVAQPAFWGLLATCVAPIPVVGTAIVWVPLCIVLWFSGSIASAIGLAAWGIVAVAGIDNVLRPLFLRQGINAPVFVLVLAILCGLSTFGPVGLIAGPVLVAFSVQAMREADRLLHPVLADAAEPGDGEDAADS